MKTFITFVSIFLNLLLFAQNLPLGKINQIKHTRYNVTDSFGIVTKTNINSINIESYDSSGKLIKEIKYNPDTIFFHRKEFKYDSVGRLIQKDFSHKNPSYGYRELYRYGGANSSIETSRYSGNSQLQERHFEQFDSHKNIIESKTIDSAGNVTFYEKNIYVYNSLGKLTEKKTFGSGDFYLGKETYKHDSNGNLIEKNIISSDDGSTISKEIYKYDSQNRLIEMEEYSGTPSEIQVKEITNYDTNGSIVYLKRSIFSIDRYGVKSIDEQTTDYIYKYDENNNWISKLRFENTIPKMWETREISYFP